MRSKQTLFLLLYLFLASSALATHFRCGQILVRQMAPGSTTVRITVEVFLNTVETNVLFGGEDDWLDFGDGTRMLVPEQENITRYDLNPNGSVAYAQFTISHTYPVLGHYTISYSEPNRNAAVVNFTGSVNTRFYIESGFLLMTDRAYQTPVPLLPPIFHGFIEDDFSASIAAVDSNNFALLYSLEVPLKDKSTPVSNYEQSGSALVNPMTGLLTWDCKLKGENVPGEFLYAVKIRQYDTAVEPWKEVGHCLVPSMELRRIAKGFSSAQIPVKTWSQLCIVWPNDELAGMKCDGILCYNCN